MRIIIVRHGDPNYELDTLTKTGWREAELAAEYLEKLQIKAFYVSPLGRTGYRRMYFEKNEPDGRDIRLAS